MTLMIDFSPSKMMQIGLESPFNCFDLKGGHIDCKDPREWVFLFQKYKPRHWDLVVCCLYIGINFDEKTK